MIRWRLGPYRGRRDDYGARRRWQDRAALQNLLWVLFPLISLWAALLWSLGLWP